MQFQKTISLILATALCMAIFTISYPTPAHAKLSWNDRRAVVLECFYAIDQDHDGGCNKTITGQGGTWCVSNWNYLYDDPFAYVTVRSWYGCDASVWRPMYSISNCNTISAQSDFYNWPWDYGYGYFGGQSNPVGRGGQCKYFANLILYRAGVCWSKFPSYQDMWNNGEWNLATVKEGDVIIRNDSQPHTAIVVEIKRDWYGNITGVDVIDSNYISDTGVKGREVIARHLLRLSDINGLYRIWKGSSYYGSDYVPWA